jgi:hypothetical protein
MNPRRENIMNKVNGAISLTIKTWGCIFGCVWPFYEQAVSDLNL